LEQNLKNWLEPWIFLGNPIMHQAAIAKLSEAGYLAGEMHSQVRHEYVDGHVYAMAGASKAHNTIALNLASRLRQHLRGTPCRAFIADMKVRVAARAIA
jgi:Uma2 family endonuclease